MKSRPKDFAAARLPSEPDGEGEEDTETELKTCQHQPGGCTGEIVFIREVIAAGLKDKADAG